MREWIFFLASLAGAAVLAALTVILSPQSSLWKTMLWGGIAVLVVCAIALLIDILGVNRHRMLALTSMVVFGLGFLGSAAVYFWPQTPTTDEVSQSTAGTPVKPTLLSIATIGSLKYVRAGLEIDHKISTKEVAAQIAITLHNTNDFLIKFHASLDGVINGVTSSRGRIEFGGYVYANDDTTIRYDKLFGIRVPAAYDIKTPAIVSKTTYKIIYWAADNEMNKRETNKTLRIEISYSPFTNKPGMKTEAANVLFENEVEK